MFLFSLYSLSLCYITLLIFFFSICLYTRLSPIDIFPPSKPFSKPATHVPWSVSWRAPDFSVTFTNQRAKHVWKGQEKNQKVREIGTYIFCRCETWTLQLHTKEDDRYMCTSFRDIFIDWLYINTYYHYFWAELLCRRLCFQPFYAGKKCCSIFC